MDLKLYSNYCFCLQCIVLCLLCSVQGLLARSEGDGVIFRRVQLASLGLVGVSKWFVVLRCRGGVWRSEMLCDCTTLTHSLTCPLTFCYMTYRGDVRI